MDEEVEKLERRLAQIKSVVAEFEQELGDLSRERESSEQFVWLNRRYGEMETQLSRWAITPSFRADSSQDEVI